jgi:N-methylhydantoinase A
VSTLRVGIDVGGTFTDLAATDSTSGERIGIKVPTTSREPERAVLAALETLLARYGEPPAIEFLAHSTTIATNALLGQLGLELPRVALVTTQGFRDVIEIGRQNRSEVYNLHVERPRPLVAREDRCTVRERLAADGTPVVPLDEVSLERACLRLRERRPDAVAVCLLHSYANDAHELRVARAVSAAIPRATVVCSSQVDPEYREYERFSTTVVNAVLAPIVQRYLERLIAALRARGVTARLYVMRSDGGLADARRVAALPAAIVESGPAAGVVAAAQLGANVLSFDMGGTTAKTGTILGGSMQIAHEFEAAGRTHSGRAIKGSGYPVRFPFVDLAEASAGGGTIAWIDDASCLRVGPVSAGADPGPACYGRSDRATVTDANVVLGRLHQTHLLGGSFPIDARRSRDAVGALAKRIGLSIEETAAGIVTLVDTQMAKILRIVTVERGLDPRDFTLVAFGGGGPLHACALAAELGIPRVLIPPDPGLFCAYGLLVAELRESIVRPILRSLRDLACDDLERSFSADERRAGDALAAQGAPAQTLRFTRQYDARYRGQSFELTIEHDASIAAIERRFHDAHRRRYGYAVHDADVEIVNARLTATASVARPSASGRHAAPGSLSAAKRRVWLDAAPADVPIYQRSTLAGETSIDGPAIVEQYDATTYVAPGWRLRVADPMLELTR